MDTSLDKEHCATNFLFECQCFDEQKGYCRLELRRHCERNRHLYDQPDSTELYTRICTKKVADAFKRFQQRLPSRNDLNYHLELLADHDRWQDLRQRVLTDDAERWPFAARRPFRLTPVQGGVCICTNTPDNRAAIRAVVEQHYRKYYHTIVEYNDEKDKKSIYCY